MKAKSRQSGLSLIEQTVVVATVAMLAYFGLPAARTFFNSLETTGGGKAMISAALASARAIAAREQKYAGIRFQHAYHPDGPLEAAQYMIYIVHDYDNTGLANGFRAVEGLEPVKLPDAVGVMDLRINDNERINQNSEISSDDALRDTTTFSIIFSPSGKIVIHNVRVRNRDGYTNTNNDSEDDIFNTEHNVKNEKIAMFLQDYNNDGFEEEHSRNAFLIYNRFEFEKIPENRRYSDYLGDLVDSMIYINPYTGTMINR